MVELFYTNKFLKSAKKLPKQIKKKLSSELVILERNPFDSLLHTKQLTGSLVGYYSFRITRDWRVIFNFIDTKTVKLIDVAHRKDIYK